MDEKREAPRFKINQLIGYYPNREEYLWAEGVDISLGGISCRSKEAVDTLTNVFLMVTVRGPDGDHLVRVEGFVAHSEMVEGYCRFGVRIERIFDEDRPHLEAYLAGLADGPPAEEGPGKT
jgi:hypothetical protein